MHLTQLSAFFGLLAAAEACLLPGETEDGHVPLTRRSNSTGSTIRINVGDRFNGGTKAPRGLGSQPAGTRIESVMNVAEIQSAVQGLVTQFGIKLFTAPDPTAQGATMFGGKIGNGLDCDEAFRVYLMSGIHARERGGPDNLIYFISDLLWAQFQGTGLTYGDMTYTYEEVLTALSTGIVFMPLINPDGVAYDQATNSCWRKNRNPSGAVDLNRNFDFLWDFETDFAPGQPITLASSNPNHDTYHGQSAFSEAETRNVKWVMDQFKNLRWFVDLHSFAGLVLYPWGDDTNQALNTNQAFTNGAYGGKRGVIPDESGLEYKEYITYPDWDAAIIAATKVAVGMQGATNRHYDARQSAYLYPTSGTSTDYAFSRSLADSNLNKLYGFTIEFGFEGPGSCPFYPSVDQFQQSILETGAGFMEFLLTAARQGLGSPRECPSSDGAPSFGNSYCFCQAGYKATGIADTDTSKQYHLSWVNDNGDQTHRVLVNPGQDCWDVCGDNLCSEVPLKDSCR
ncbi:zinc carboxypeptidase [Dactylonectria macrodidyma]|uniref:Zinc carboxypeptidase n=1 Tax=Dactylonectria macrodidyma TaxID=307937 RepID=A0A9P9FMH8_9HYPO|nr:zinc carboxypeptidase [Dactylonectria macrodidyma]